MALGSPQPLTEMGTRNISWGVKADNLTIFMRRLSKNLGDSTCWNPKGLSRPAVGLRDLLINFSISSLVTQFYTLNYFLSGPRVV
jgi:hypothetical protein